MILFLTVLFGVILSPMIGTANILRVPSEIPTIQSAFNAVENSDTVLIAIGEYHEDLLAPIRQFWMIGEVPADSGDFLRPVIDPSMLSADSIQRGCLVLPAGSLITIERMRFRNRLDISQLTEVGGIHLQADSAAFRDCAFDSTYMGIYQSQTDRARVLMDRCLFKNNRGAYAFLPGSAVHVNHCYFSGANAFTQLIVGTQSIVENSRFDSAAMTYLSNWGENVIIRNNAFGPGGPHNYYPIDLPAYVTRFENNVIHDLQLRAPALHIHANCVDIENPTLISNNIFFNCNRLSGANAMLMHVYCDSDTVISNSYLVENNQMSDCQTGGISKAIWANGKGVLRNNRIYDLPNSAIPAIYCETNDTLIFRDNIISGNGYGLLNSEFRREVDATHNYWGDSTGPYHPTENPNGQGDWVSNRVRFSPWQTDSLFFNEADNPSFLQPTSFVLSSYPNPFNPTATISFSLPQTAQVKLTVYDITGREVKQLLNEQKTAGEYHQKFDGANLSSGIYFARLQTTDFSHIQKIVLLK